MQANAQKLNI